MKIYLIYHHNYDDCNHLGYCMNKDDAEKVCDQENIKLNSHSWSNMIHHKELELMIVDENNSPEQSITEDET